MFRKKRFFAAAGIFAASLLVIACHTTGMSGSHSAPPFPKLLDGTSLPAANARLTGTLIRDGDFLRVAGNGSTIIIWPRTQDGARGRVGINTIVVWPRGAKLERRREGGGTVVVVWPRGIGAGTPVRVGERVELVGIVLVDNLPGSPAPADIITADNVSGRAALSDIIVVTDNITGRLADCPRARGCAGPVFVASEIRPAPGGSQ